MQITLCDKPAFLKKKLSPQQQAGLCYERKVFKFFRQQKNLFSSLWKGDLIHSPWFKVEDQRSYFLNPDILLINPKLITVFECKLSQNDLAIAQINKYAKLCLEYFGLPVNAIIVFRNLYRPTSLITSLPLLPANQTLQWHIFL